MKKIICSILLVLFTCTFCVCIYRIIQIKQEYDFGVDTYSALEVYASIPQEPATPEGGHAPGRPVVLPNGETEYLDSFDPEVEITRWPVVDFTALSAINPDIVAWIYIPGTNIHYPVVQGKDNDEYLYCTFDGNYNRAGCIFLDANVTADFSGQNSIIHGHNLLNNTMFASLLSYQDQSFYEEHPIALLITPEGKYRIAFFSAYVSDVYSGAWNTAFSDEDFVKWQSKIAGKSCFSTDITPTPSDRIVTLSTCSYEFSNARFVVHGILLPEEE